MKRESFVFKIEGANVSPETVKLRDLFPILQEFERAVVITAKSRGATDADDLGFSLAGVEEGSDTIILSASPKMYRAADEVTQAIAGNSFSAIPVMAHSDLRKLWNRAKSKSWTFSFFSHHSNVPRAAISPDVELLLPNEIQGCTTVLARINRVGGEKDPTVHLLLANGDQITARVHGRDLAKELGDKLFDVVGLRGEAVWDIESWKLKEFAVAGITDFVDTPAVVAFEQLSEGAGEAWDEIDAVEFVHSSRAE